MDHHERWKTDSGPASKTFDYPGPIGLEEIGAGEADKTNCGKLLKSYFTSVNIERWLISAWRLALFISNSHVETGLLLYKWRKFYI